MGYRVLVIDDSLTFQRVMAQILQGLPEIAGVEVAANGQEGLARLAQGKFDIVFLDLNMPGMNGMDVLRHLKAMRSLVPVIVVSAAGGPGSRVTIEALEYGALDFILKPVGSDFRAAFAQLRGDLSRALQILAQKKSQGSGGRPTVSATSGVAVQGVGAAPASLVVMASSTGGPQSLLQVIPRLRASFPVPLLLVQHMPPGFTDSLATSLNAHSQVKVVEAEDGMALNPGTVYIAPGGRHMVLAKATAGLVLTLNDGPKECYVRPAADVLLRSLSRVPGLGKVLAVVMTGMGKDGCRGVEILKRKNCYCLAQDEATSVVYGMPRAITDAGLADEVVPLGGIASRLGELTATRPAVGAP